VGCCESLERASCQRFGVKGGQITREEILKLEAGPQLNRLVAERIMGWTEGPDFWVSFEGVVHLKAGESSPGHIVYRGESWSPSTDIAAAMEVVNGLVDLGWLVNLLSPWKGNATCHWTCYVERQGKSGWERLEAVGDSAPVAICRAALLAVMEAGNE